MELKAGCCGRKFDANKMYLYLKGVFEGANMSESMRALRYMREHHAGQMRKDGHPYEVHPLMMACYAVSLSDEHITDEVMATILLHDVCEDTAAVVEELPFNGLVKQGVKYVTLTKFDNETGFEQKKRYMNELLESKAAVITKPIDRYVNLTTMSGSFTPDKIRKNVVETDMLLLPILKKAKYKYPEMTRLLWVLRTNVQSINDTLAIQLKVKLTDENFVNHADATDYSYLVTGETAS